MSLLAVYRKTYLKLIFSFVSKQHASVSFSHGNASLWWTYSHRIRTISISGSVYYAQAQQNNERNETNGTSPGRPKRTKDLNKKLHNRVLTKEEHLDNKLFKQSTETPYSESDTFGFARQDKERYDGKFCKLSSLPSKKSNNNKNEDRIQDLATSSTGNTEHHNDNDSLQDLATSSTGNTEHHNDNDSYFQNTDNMKLKYKEINLRKSRQDNSWGDEFGTLQDDDLVLQRAEESLMTTIGSHEERLSSDSDEEREDRIPLSKYNRRRIPEWYGRQIFKLGKKGEVRLALEVFEDWMLKTDRVMPNAYVFTCLLTILGRAGYTQKAFYHFNKMKKMAIQPNHATYTALFNACANSPWKHDGLKRADNLYQLMKEKEVEPTFITGKAMVKAFAMCGDLRRAFAITDELCTMFRPDPELFSFILMACISDREAGLRHAIQVWRLMHQLGVQPDLPLYNLLLRCVRDCGVGDASEFQTLLTSGALPTLPPSSGRPGLKTATRTQTATKGGVSRSGGVSQSGGVTDENKLLAVRRGKTVLSLEGSGRELLAGDAYGMKEEEGEGCTVELLPHDDHFRHNDSEKAERFSIGDDKAGEADFEKLRTFGGRALTDYQSFSDNLDTDRKVHPVQPVQSKSAKQMAVVLKPQLSDATRGIPFSSPTNPESRVTIPDLLSPTFDSAGLVSVGDLSTRDSRLAALGGMDGVLSRMGKDGARPDIVTFCQLISVVPPTCEAEEALVARMESQKVNPDVDLVNTLIHKRCMRRDFAAAKAAVKLIQDHHLIPNHRTFGVLAMTCRTQEEAEQLLAEMEAADMAVSIEILGTFMQAAGMKFHYRLWVLKQVQRQDLHPNVKFLQHCESGLAVVKRKIVEAEKREDGESFYLSVRFQKSVERFERHYKAWLAEAKMERPPHPWKAFKPAP